MVVNDNAGNLTPRGVLQLIASRLAPTFDSVRRSMWERACSRRGHDIHRRNPAHRQPHLRLGRMLLSASEVCASCSSVSCSSSPG
ncbi:hypothetical protein C4E44_35185 [Pseudomonas sp. MWU12-2312b]|nr:hypothetical protein C4E44_35185 [Pseudomonas sp. MWU12-2312b]